MLAEFAQVGWTHPDPINESLRWSCLRFAGLERMKSGHHSEEAVSLKLDDLK
jgi:hypothetical protein